MRRWRFWFFQVGAVLKKIIFLALETRGWKFTCSKNIVALLLSSKEKAVSIIFLTCGHFVILGKGEMPEKTQNDAFWVRLMVFWPESPASDVEKWISGFFRASGNQQSTFLHPSKVPPSVRAPCPLFTPRTSPTSSCALGEFRTYFYNHAHRPRLKKNIIILL